MYFYVVLSIVLLDVVHVVVIELCKIHYFDVISCCARCCCKNHFPYLVVEFLVEIIVTDDVDFAHVLLDVEGILNVERLVVHYLVVRSGCSQRCLPYLCCELLLNHSALMMLIFLMLEWMSRTLSVSQC